MNLKLMVLNTQHCKNFNTKKIDYISIVNLINKYNPDIIGLNEMYYGQTNIIAKKLGYNYHFGKSTNIYILPYGNSIISRYPIISTKIIKIPGNSIEKRSILEAKIEVDKNIFTIYITHLGLTISEQKNGIDTLLKYVKNESSIIMGDFNTENISILKPIKDKFIDSEIKFKNKLYSWPSNSPNKKIDYIFTSKDINIVKSTILDEIISDHKPLIIEIKIKNN